MSRAVLCPVCNGSGVVADNSMCGGTSVANPTKVCHGCGGKGWVAVSDYSPVMPYTPMPYLPSPWYPLPNTPWYYNPGPTCGTFTYSKGSEVI